MQCARHPKVETNLACGRCGKGICPACSIPGPVGMRCRECSSLRSSALYQVHPGRFALATLIGLAAGTILGVLLGYAAGFFIYLLLFVGPVVGKFMADFIMLVVGRKRGWKIEALAGVSVVGGAILSQALFGGWTRFWGNPIELIVFGVAVLFTAATAVARIRQV